VPLIPKGSMLEEVEEGISRETDEAKFTCKMANKQRLLVVCSNRLCTAPFLRYFHSFRLYVTACNVQQSFTMVMTVKSYGSLNDFLFFSKHILTDICAECLMVLCNLQLLLAF